MVVGKLIGQVTQRRLRLDGHVVLVIVDVQHCARRVADTPDNGGRDLDRVAAFVVDLELLAVEVAQAQAHLVLVHERVGPAQAGGVVRAAVLAEQHEQRRLVRLQHVNALEQEEECEQQHHGHDRQPGEDHEWNGQQSQEGEGQRHVAAGTLELDLFGNTRRFHYLLP
jgi:hypothetical protein